MNQAVTLSVDQGVALIRIDNPPVNALSPGGHRRPRRRDSIARARDDVGSGDRHHRRGPDVHRRRRHQGTRATGVGQRLRRTRDARAAAADRGPAQAGRHGDARHRARRRPRGRDGRALPRRRARRADGTARGEPRHHPWRRRHAATAAARRSREGDRDVRLRQADQGRRRAERRAHRSHHRRRPRDRCARPSRARWRHAAARIRRRASDTDKLPPASALPGDARRRPRAGAQDATPPGSAGRRSSTRSKPRPRCRSPKAARASARSSFELREVRAGQGAHSRVLRRARRVEGAWRLEGHRRRTGAIASASSAPGRWAAASRWRAPTPASRCASPMRRKTALDSGHRHDSQELRRLGETRTLHPGDGRGADDANLARRSATTASATSI